MPSVTLHNRNNLQKFDDCLKLREIQGCFSSLSYPIFALSPNVLMETFPKVEFVVYPHDYSRVKVWIPAHSDYSMLVTMEIPLNGAFVVRSKSESFGLQVEAKLDF